MAYRFVIADDEPITLMDIREMLEEAGHIVVGEAGDGFDAIELCKKHAPDMVIIDIKMPILDGLKASQIIINEKLARGVILLTAYSSKNFVKQASEVGVVGYLVKPVKENYLLPMIEVGMKKCQELEKAQKDLSKAEAKLEDRKLLEKAKGILMKNQGLNENDAYTNLRKLSMNKRCSLKEIAKVIILND